MRTSAVSPQVPPHDSLLTIGELARRTGLTPELIRTWESRHGFPAPERLPSGHRRYRESDVAAVEAVLARRDAGVRLERAISEQQRGPAEPVPAPAPAATTTGSVFGDLRLRHPDLVSYTLAKRTLLALSWAIEDECCAQGARPVLIGSFQRGVYFRDAESRWSELARVASDALVLADFDGHDDAASPARVALPQDSPLLREWIVICEGAHLSAALVAFEIPGQHDVPGGRHQFETVWSVEPPLVRDAALSAASVAAEAGSMSAQRLLAKLSAAPLPQAADPRMTQRVLTRMVAYSDGTVLRQRRSAQA